MGKPGRRAWRGDICQRLPIPRDIVSNIEDELSDFALLKGPSGKICRVELKITDRELLLHNGWQDFVKDHSLCYEDHLVFEYEGSSLFSVSILGKFPEAFESCENLNSNEGYQNSDKESTNTVETLGVSTSHKACCTSTKEIEDEDLQPTETRSNLQVLRRSPRLSVLSNVTEMGKLTCKNKSECSKQKNRSEELFIKSEIPRNEGNRFVESENLQQIDERYTLLEPRRSVRLKLAQSDKKLTCEMKSECRKQKCRSEELFIQAESPVNEGKMFAESENLERYTLIKPRRSVRLKLDQSDQVQMSNSSPEVKLNHNSRTFNGDTLSMESGSLSTTPKSSLPAQKRDNKAAPRRSTRISIQSNVKGLPELLHISVLNCTKRGDRSEQASNNSKTRSTESATPPMNEFSEKNDNQTAETNDPISSPERKGGFMCVDEGRLYCRFVSRRRPVTDEEKDRALYEARKFKSSNPFFMVVMPPTYVLIRFYMHIPSEFVKAHISRKMQNINLEVKDGKKWPVKCIFRGAGAGLSKGWAAFVWGNNLEASDICIFELVEKKKMEFKVIIFRVVDEVVPLINLSKKKKKPSKKNGGPRFIEFAFPHDKNSL
ncbi:uncharacterized protein LOC143857723 [Tasmannia lanceolata]|uniref:uncharacterized protein LOC143857723 n=1 Tax=Tasmannia lanceolata TaxID=3420 RepID=UPI00406415EE